MKTPNLTAKQERQRKVKLFLPMIVIPFLTMLVWSLGLGKGNPALEAQAKSLMALSREGSTKGEYELYNLDKPGQKIVIERDVMDNVIAELITAQMETPLSVLEGKTFSSILPPLKTIIQKWKN